MRVHLTDGTHEISIETRGHSRRHLTHATDTALHILDALRATDTNDEHRPHRFGFTTDDALDGTSLDSSTERAEPYDNRHDQDDDQDDDKGDE